MNRGWLVDVAVRKIAIRAVDLACVSVAFWVAYFLRSNLERLPVAWVAPSTLNLSVVNLANAHHFFSILATAWLIVALTLHHFEQGVRMRTLSAFDECYGVVRSLLVAFVIILAVTSLYSRYAFSRGAMLLFFALSVALVSAWRVALKTVLRAVRRRGYNWVKILILGAGQVGRVVKDQVHGRRDFGYRLVGFLDDDRDLTGGLVDAYPVLGTRHAIARVVASEGIDDVIVALPDAGREDLLEIARLCEAARVNMVLVPSLFDLSRSELRLGHLGHVPLMSFSAEPPAHADELAKRAFDIVLSLVLLIVLSPFLLLVGLALAIDSKGPILFRQVRVGRHGRHFVMYKFRSMVDGAPEPGDRLHMRNDVSGGVIFKMKDDPRVTRVGRWLRRFSIDEIPQLANVLRGDMSLVGPRPPLVTEVQRYSDWERRRLLTTPGLTGLWQISGRSETTFQRMVELDLHYIEHWSFWTDLGILLRSIPQVISGRGAY